MIESLYLDTSIIGYLTIRPSTNLITASNSVITQSWWDTRRQNFTLYISEVVLEELARGDQGYELPTICTPYELMGD